MEQLKTPHLHSCTDIETQYKDKTQAQQQTIENCDANTQAHAEAHETHIREIQAEFAWKEEQLKKFYSAVDADKQQRI